MLAEYLHRDCASQLGVGGPKDRSHSSLANEFFEGEVFKVTTNQFLAGQSCI